MPVIAADVDNKTIIYDDGQWKTKVGGWLEYQEGQTVSTPSMPFVQGTYPEYLVSVGNGTITQDELSAQGTIWQTVASNYSVGDTIPIKLCLSEDNSNWDEYDATCSSNAYRCGYCVFCGTEYTEEIENSMLEQLPSII